MARQTEKEKAEKKKRNVKIQLWMKRQRIPVGFNSDLAWGYPLSSARVHVGQVPGKESFGRCVASKDRQVGSDVSWQRQICSDTLSFERRTEWEGKLRDFEASLDGHQQPQPAPRPTATRTPSVAPRIVPVLENHAAVLKLPTTPTRPERNPAAGSYPTPKSTTKKRKRDQPSNAQPEVGRHIGVAAEHQAGTADSDVIEITSSSELSSGGEKSRSLSTAKLHTPKSGRRKHDKPVALPHTSTFPAQALPENKPGPSNKLKAPVFETGESDSDEDSAPAKMMKQKLARFRYSGKGERKESTAKPLPHHSKLSTDKGKGSGAKRTRTSNYKPSDDESGVEIDESRSAQPGLSGKMPICL